jgi:hypothetical protein
MKNPVRLLIIMSAICGILLIFTSIKSCNNKKRFQIEREISQHNYAALTDSLKKVQDINGNLMYEKKVLISTNEELEYLNQNLSEKISTLSKKNDVKIVTGLDGDVIVDGKINKEDSLIINDINNLHIDTNLTTYFNDSLLNATVSYNLLINNNNLKLTHNNINYNVNIPVESYFTSDARIILRSSNQNVHFSNINAFVDPAVINAMRKKKWVLSINASLGIGAGYDLIDKNISMPVGIQIGIGIGRKIKEW